MGFDDLLEGLFRRQGGHHGGHHGSRHERVDRCNQYPDDSWKHVGEEDYNKLAKYCPNCSSPVKPEALFCIQCGTAIGGGRRCFKCQSAIPVGAKFCSNCGSKQEY